MYPLKDIVEVLFGELHKRAEDWERKQLAYLQKIVGEDAGWQRQKRIFSLSRRMTAVVQELARQLYALH